MQGSLQERRGRNSFPPGPGCSGDRLEGVTGNECPYKGHIEPGHRGVPGGPRHLHFFISTLTHSEKDLRPDWKGVHLTLNKIFKAKNNTHGV